MNQLRNNNLDQIDIHVSSNECTVIVGKNIKALNDTNIDTTTEEFFT